MSDQKINGLDYKYKLHQLIKIPYPLTNESQTASFFVDSETLVDKIRISVSSDLTIPTLNIPSVVIYSDIVNNIIGVIGTKYSSTIGANNIFIDLLQSSNGIEFFFPTKVQLAGEYNLIFSLKDGSIPNFVNPNGNDNVYILIEYCQS